MLLTLSGEEMVARVVQVLPRSVDRCTRNAVSVIELSLQVSTARRLLPPALMSVLVRPFGATGGSTSDCGRIMSISSWLRMWQCQTYSQP